MTTHFLVQCSLAARLLSAATPVPAALVPPHQEANLNLLPKMNQQLCLRHCLSPLAARLQLPSICATQLLHRLFVVHLYHRDLLVQNQSSHAWLQLQSNVGHIFATLSYGREARRAPGNHILLSLSACALIPSTTTDERLSDGRCTSAFLLVAPRRMPSPHRLRHPCFRRAPRRTCRTLHCFFLFVFVTTRLRWLRWLNVFDRLNSVHRRFEDSGQQNVSTVALSTWHCRKSSETTYLLPIHTANTPNHKKSPAVRPHTQCQQNTARNTAGKKAMLETYRPLSRDP